MSDQTLAEVLRAAAADGQTLDDVVAALEAHNRPDMAATGATMPPTQAPTVHNPCPQPEEGQ